MVDIKYVQYCTVSTIVGTQAGINTAVGTQVNVSIIVGTLVECKERPLVCTLGLLP